MGLLRRAFGRSQAAPPGGEPAGREKFVAEPQPRVKFSLDVPQEITGLMQPENIDQRISRREALQVPAVMRARNLICGTLATLPVRYHGPGRHVIEWPLFDQPDPDLPNAVSWAMVYEDLLFEGISWWRVTEFGWHGFPTAARHVPPESVFVAGSPAMPSVAQITPDQPFPIDGQVFIDGYPVPDNQIIRFDSPNPPLLVHGARAIRTCLRLDAAAALAVKDPTPQGYFAQPEGSDLLSTEEGSAADGSDRSEVEALMDEWEDARRRRDWVYMGALKAEILQWDPEKLQLHEQRQHAVLEIARLAGIDPEDLGVSTTSRTYQNSEQRRRDLLDFTLGSYVSAVQDRLSMRDVAAPGHTARIDFGGFLRSDTLQRMQTYEIGLRVGAYTPEEIRELEDRPPLPPGARPTPPQTPAPPVQREETPAMSDSKASLAFASEGEADTVKIQFAGDSVSANFTVDTERRTIIGLAVPWNKVAWSGGAKWRFGPGSLRWTDPSRIKLNMDHSSQLVGAATRVQESSEGLVITFKIGRGPERDQILADAEDGLLDGLSIEVEFDRDAGDSWQPDAEDRTVRFAVQGALVGCALTPAPSFADARVTRVAASKNGEGAMPQETKTEGVAAETGNVTFDQSNFDQFMGGVADKIAKSHEQLTTDLGQSIGESVAAGFKAALETLPAPQDGPGTVRAARFTVTREAPVYNFNGAGHSLVRDSWYAASARDEEAIARLRKFRMQTEEVGTLAASHLVAAQFSPQSTSTASAVIPPGYRPDLYVAELMKGRPLVAACARGVIANATPFTVPTFTSSTDASGDHTEGVNPDDGSLSLGTKTVTPTAISGRLVLTREIIDSSNPAIDQIAMATMRESYARQTEAKVYTLLNGANGAGGTIDGSGFVPSGAQAATYDDAAGTAYPEQVLIKGIRGRMAAYPFNRFASPTAALMGQNATSILATVEDANGRPLFPSVAPQNAVGTGNAVTQGWNIDGLVFQPAWAMTGTAAGDSQVLILNSSDMWVWESPLLTFRFEEKQGPANIELNLFGYFGTHLLRPVGLSGIRIT